MSDSIRSTTVTISNPQGLHMRPAYLFAETASKFGSMVNLVKGDVRVDGKSVLDILTLGATQGTEILLEANGEDAQAAIDLLAELVNSGFPATRAASDSAD